MATETSIEGTPVNERLTAAGLLPAFEAAVQARDMAEVQRCLEAIQLNKQAVLSVFEHVETPSWAVRVEVVRRFAPRHWRQVSDILDQLDLPLLGGPDRLLDRARVQIAIIRLALGDPTTLQHWAREAAVDWRDVLVAAGLANANWRDLLVRQGYAVPSETGDKP